MLRGALNRPCSFLLCVVLVLAGPFVGLPRAATATGDDYPSALKTPDTGTMVDYWSFFGMVQKPGDDVRAAVHIRADRFAH